mmetsp:Transcript_6790/g.20183  ORF Transcript_6790/g.20183 Transcript_6790/m.20183 type:complete len:236 (-) Transcript_6790:1822-2529(-)
MDVAERPPRPHGRGGETTASTPRERTPRQRAPGLAGGPRRRVLQNPPAPHLRGRRPPSLHVRPRRKRFLHGPQLLRQRRQHEHGPPHRGVAGTDPEPRRSSVESRRLLHIDQGVRPTEGRPQHRGSPPSRPEESRPARYGHVQRADRRLRQLRLDRRGLRYLRDVGRRNGRPGGRRSQGRSPSQRADVQHHAQGLRAEGRPDHGIGAVGSHEQGGALGRRHHQHIGQCGRQGGGV